MVYNINNLREAVETAKHMLMKEEIDGHKSGQANSIPFMKVNQQNFKKKGVTFNTMETIQKQGDSIDTLTSLMNELSRKLDKKGNPPQYKPRIHPGRNRGCRQRQNRYNSRAEIPRIIDSIIEGKILAKGMTKDLDIEVSVENMIDPEPGIEVPQEKTLKIDIKIIKVKVGKGKGPELLPQKETQGQGQDPVPELVLIETG